MTAETGGGIKEAARLIAAMGTARAANARALAYRLHNAAERRGWAAEARACNILITSWQQIQKKVAELATGGTEQLRLEL